MRELYPSLSPTQQGKLPVSDLHTLYYEVSGNPEGVPVVFVHGGPGAGCEASHRRFFDPARYRIILFDQRGCGRSKPFAELTENTSWNLVADMEQLREHLQIAHWHVFGGSWGSTLALLYAVCHPERVLSLVLRGIFLLRQAEIDWFYQAGASQLFPDLWEAFLKPIPPAEQGNLVRAYYQRLTSKDPQIQMAAAQAWSVWEASTSKLRQDRATVAKFGESRFALAFARIECHYFIHRGFFTTDNYLLDQIERIRRIPGVIVHGRYDVICPLKNAWDLHRAWPEATLHIVEDAGHSAFEPGIIDKLIGATDQFAGIIAPSV